MLAILNEIVPENGSISLQINVHELACPPLELEKYCVVHKLFNLVSEALEIKVLIDECEGDLVLGHPFIDILYRSTFYRLR
jgi:hypothetical protein